MFIVKNFDWIIANTFILSYWAIISGCICAFIVFLPEEPFGNEHFMFSFVAGLFGLILASPLLISIFLPWYYICDRKCTFLKWVSVPAISSLIYLPFIHAFSVPKIASFEKYQLLAVFTLTGILLSTIMWKFYSPRYDTEDNTDEVKKITPYDIFCIASLVAIIGDVFYLVGLQIGWWNYNSGCLNGFNFGSTVSADCKSETFKLFHSVFSNPFFEFKDYWKVEKFIIGNTVSLFVYFSAIKSLFLIKKIQFNPKSSMQENAQNN